MDNIELNNQLLQVREAMAEQERLSRALEHARRSLEEERRQLQNFAEEKRKESEDVRQLEGASLSGLFYAILGSKEERLEKERHEMLAAGLKYENCRRRVTALERDVAGLRARLDGLGGSQDLQARLESLLAEKERLISAVESPAALRLAELNTSLGGLRSKEKELREAETAGGQAQAGLGVVIDRLESAGNWGTFDILGGGMIASAVKQSKLDEAHAAVQEVQPLLQRFERELADVGGPGGVQVETGGLAAFADIFVDSLLVDLLVQSRINESREAARAMERRVGEILDSLKKQLADTSQQAQVLETERRGLLEGG